MDKLYEDSETGCCKKFNPEPWDEKEITFNEKLFIKDKVTSFFHMPLNFGSKMKKNVELIMKAKAQPEEPLMLSDECSLFGSDLYIHVKHDVEGAEMAKLSGTYMTKVFEGSFKNMKTWITEMNKYVEGKDKKVKKLYFFYTTCPRCAKHYGKNYTVIFAEV